MADLSQPPSPKTSSPYPRSLSAAGMSLADFNQKLKARKVILCKALALAVLPIISTKIILSSYSLSDSQLALASMVYFIQFAFIIPVGFAGATYAKAIHKSTISGWILGMFLSLVATLRITTLFTFLLPRYVQLPLSYILNLYLIAFLLCEWSLSRALKNIYEVQFFLLIVKPAQAASIRKWLAASEAADADFSPLSAEPK